MRELKNALYIMSEDAYLRRDGDNIIIEREGEKPVRCVLSYFDNIITFSYRGASPALMGYCVEHNIGLSFCKPGGRFLARVTGPVSGNIFLRREQYRVADNPDAYVRISRNMIAGKLRNQKAVLDKFRHNHANRLDAIKLQEASGFLAGYAKQAAACIDPEELRGIEGLGAKAYFGVFDDLILSNKDTFCFKTRTRRPPLDCLNALLSFGYVMLGNYCAWALESFGLDAQAGFLHRDRPGRKSLALDLEEEFRPIFVDRLVLTMINNRQMSEADFKTQDSGAVYMTDDGCNKFLKAWEAQKKETAKHPYLGEELPFGLMPYVQAQLLARHLRGDLEEYPPLFWR